MWNIQRMPFKVADPHYYNDFFGRALALLHFLGIECWPVVIQWENSAAIPCTEGVGSMMSLRWALPIDVGKIHRNSIGAPQSPIPSLSLQFTT